MAAKYQTLSTLLPRSAIDNTRLNTTVLVTGANGFIGRAVCAELLKCGVRVCAAVRDEASEIVSGAERYCVGDLAGPVRWPLASVDTVVHLAGIAHDMRGTGAEGRYQAVNRDATEQLARQAASAGVRRLVFASSIKVNGERTTPEARFSECDPAHPADRYARSKWAAERRLRAVAAATGLEVVVVRPPLVYGPGVRANFDRFVRLVKKGLPLPLASIRNRRSLLFVGNLADVLVYCVSARDATGGTFLVSDGAPVSTPQLCREIGEALGRPARLFPFPPALLPRKLVGSLEVDDSAIRALGWRPPFTRQEGLKATADWYLGR